MAKKSICTILLVVAVNIILFLGHMIAIFGLGFNDSGDVCPSVFHLLPNLLFCIGPLVVGSVVLIRLFAKKYDFYEPVLYVVQGLLVVWYIVVYIYSYVPPSAIRTVADSVAESGAEREQRKTDEEAREYLSDKHVGVYDEIESGGERITIYICYDSDKVIFRYCADNGERMCYCVADENYIEGKEPYSVVKYRKLDTGNTVIKGVDGRIYLSVGENRYLCLEERDLLVYCEEYKAVGALYFELLNQDVLENNYRYLPNDIIALEIKENGMVCTITEESLRRLPIMYANEYFSYGWTILRNGQQVLSRAIPVGEYTLNLKELPEEYWNQAGTYELYLHTYFQSNLYGAEHSGYIKASNSVIWEITE